MNKIIFFKNFVGAQGVKTLCLYSIMVVVLGVSSSSSALAQTVYNAPSNAAQNEVRLQQMETQLRNLTGRVEKQIYEINQLKLKIKTLEVEASAANSLPAPIPAPTSSKMGVPSSSLPSPLPLPLPLPTPEPDSAENPLNLDFKPPAPQGMKTSIPGGSTGLDTTAQYEKSYARLKSKDYEGAQIGFEQFLANHQDHVLSANAKYWLGETHYVRGEYKTAAKHFAEGFQKYPDSAKAPDILLKLGLSLVGLQKEKDACVALSQVAVKFPAGHDNIIQRAEQEMEKLDCEA